MSILHTVYVGKFVLTHSFFRVLQVGIVEVDRTNVSDGYFVSFATSERRVTHTKD